MSVVKPAIQFPILIAYLEGANNYTWLHFRDGGKTLLAKPISYLEEQPELIDFIRIHKTVLVNPVCVERLLPPPRPKTAGAVQLDSGVVLPVSRRRWSQVADLLPAKLVQVPSLRSRLVTLNPVVPSPLPAPPPPRSIIVVTDNALSSLLVSEITAQEWPRCTVHLLEEGMSLPALLGQLQPDELPVFVLLDARTARQERLNTLRLLKNDDRLNWIPVVLLVSSTNEAIREGYHRQANSVIAIGQEHTQFVETIKRIGQFWLETAALPGISAVGV